MKGLRWIVLALALGGVVVAGALLWQRFQPAGEPIAVKKLLIDVDPAAVAAGVDRERVRAVATEALDTARGLVINDDDGTAILRVRIESWVQSAAVAPEAAPADHPPLPATSSVSLAMDVIEDGRTVGRAHAVATAQGIMAPDALVGQAVRDAWRQIQQARAADALDSETLLGWLADPSTGEGQRRRAMQALASRGEKRATPALVAMLGSAEEGDAVAALQALTLLGDPAALDAIIDHSARQPALIRKLCIDAVRATASPRAVPWLFTLSSGHPDVDVQAHARAALASIAPDVAALAAGG